jgi:endonuclease/exonuclease/phosphatase family metal-dependent hydrolase
MDCQLLQRGEIVAFKEIADIFPSGMIQNKAVGSLVGLMLREQNHRAMEGAVSQRRVRQKQQPLQFERGFRIGRIVSHVGILMPPPPFANRGLREISLRRKIIGRLALELHVAGVNRIFLLALLLLGIAHADPLTIRAVAANLTSDSKQSYSPDNGNHSNPEGAGARILKALKPDIVMIQEFNTNIPVRQWINDTLGENYFFMREEGMQIPNGIISRFPILSFGSWDDPELTNREFAWAQLRLPDKNDLWVVSVHLHSKGGGSRAREATALAKFIAEKIPKDALILIGGDLNTRSKDELCLKQLARVVTIPDMPPADHLGEISTNAPRNRPYDWVLASPLLDQAAVPVSLADTVFPRGLVFDSRVFESLEKVPPVQKNDSGVPNMQHMAVVRDFKIP